MELCGSLFSKQMCQFVLLSLPGGRGRPTRIHGGDTYTRSGSVSGGGGGGMSFPSSNSNFFEDCDLSFCCNPRFAAALAFLWLIILTIVCISLGSQIGEKLLQNFGSMVA